MKELIGDIIVMGLETLLLNWIIKKRLRKWHLREISELHCSVLCTDLITSLHSCTTVTAQVGKHTVWSTYHNTDRIARWPRISENFDVCPLPGIKSFWLSATDMCAHPKTNQLTSQPEKQMFYPKFKSQNCELSIWENCSDHCCG